MEKKLVIIGTAHVLQKSVEEVTNVIEVEKPDAVAVELCPARYKALMGEREEVKVSEILKKGDFFLILLQLILGYFQRKIGEEMRTKPGEEMLTAIKKAKEINADVLLIDRDITITFKRLWGEMSFFEKLKFIYYMFRGAFGKDVEVEEMLREDIIDLLVKEFRKISPKAAKVLIDERDEFMAYNLLKAMERYNKVVAVVGAGHRRGIMEAMQKGVQNPERLLEIKQSKTFKWIGLIFIAFILTFFALTAIFAIELLYKVFLYWFLINGILAGLGALLARAHPLSALSAFLCAWLTSLNPFLAAGWISGAVEAWIRKPTMKDVEEVFKSDSLKEMLNNRFFRVILVAAMTNVGSMIGTFYGGYYILTNFGVDVMKVVSESLRFL
ncbi:MAG: TraB/GumN family protein [Archaeoglobaceae archaeon]|nr:TraB/GumN family protein [Archaeoglobaceae archaeon]